MPRFLDKETVDEAIDLEFVAWVVAICGLGARPRPAAVRIDRKGAASGLRRTKRDLEKAFGADWKRVWACLRGDMEDILRQARKHLPSYPDISPADLARMNRLTLHQRRGRPDEREVFHVTLILKGYFTAVTGRPCWGLIAAVIEANRGKKARLGYIGRDPMYSAMQGWWQQMKKRYLGKDKAPVRIDEEAYARDLYAQFCALSGKADLLNSANGPAATGSNKSKEGEMKGIKEVLAKGFDAMPCAEPLGKSAREGIGAIIAAVERGEGVTVLPENHSEEKIAAELVAVLSGVESDRLLTGRLSPADWPKITRAARTLSDAVISFTEEGNSSGREIRI